MHDWHPQDWLLIAAALAAYAGPEIDTPRDRRAWQVADEIATDQGLAVDDVPGQLATPNAAVWTDR